MTALLLFLLLNSIIAYRNLQMVIAGQHAVAQTGETLLNLQSLFSYLQDAETGQRGFLITGDESYLEPYELAIGQLDQSRKQLSLDAPQLSKEVAELDRAIDTKLAELKRSLDAFRANGPGGAETAADLVKQNNGKQAMDDVRDVVLTIRQSELQHRQELSDEFDASVGYAVGSLLVSTV
ncbi:MAG TPA: CHASE3 domain-containing protein, partial [Pirellulales bacterium]